MAVHFHPIDPLARPPRLAQDLEHFRVIIDVPRPSSDDDDEWELTAEQAIAYGARLLAAGNALQALQRHANGGR